MAHELKDIGMNVAAGFVGGLINELVNGKDPRNLDRLYKVSDIRYNKAIEERGGIRLFFTDGFDQSGDSDNKKGARTAALPTGYSRWIPFFENPRITESKASSYASSRIFGRNEPVRLWTGAEPRRLELEMTYTIPHIALFYSRDLLSRMNNKYKSREPNPNESSTDTYMYQLEKVLHSLIMYDIHKDPSVYESMIRDFDVQGPGDSAMLDAAKTKQSASQRTEGMRMPSALAEIVPADFKDSLGLGMLELNDPHSPAHLAMMKLVHYVVDHIRASVVGTVTYPLVGPPLAYLKWGTMYNEVPCIIKDYNITLDDEGGMDAKTLIPRVLKIRMNLEEIHAVNRLTDLTHYSRSTTSTNLGLLEEHELTDASRGLPGWDKFVRPERGIEGGMWGRRIIR